MIPPFGLPLSIKRKNGDAKVTQVVSGAPRIQWKLHASRGPQSMEKTEKMNHTIRTIVKLCQETNLTGNKILPAGLFRLRVAPRPSSN